MAIVSMQKLAIAADKKNRKKILEALQMLGVMHMENELIEDDELQKMDTKTASATFERNANQLEEAAALLYRYSGKKKPGGLFSEKTLIEAKTFEDAIASQNETLKKAARVLDLEKRIGEAESQIHKNEDRIVQLSPYANLDVPMNLRGTQKTRLLVGTMPGNLSVADVTKAAVTNEQTGESMDDAPLEINILSQEAGLTYVAVLCLHRQRDQILNNLRLSGFARPQQVETGVPLAVKEDIVKDIEAKKKAIEGYESSIASMADNAENFMITADYYRTRAEKYRLLSTIPQTDNVFFLEGWVEEAKADAISKYLTDNFGAFVEKQDTKEDELPPTLLKNNKFSETSEGVLESYGLPTKGRVDPTFVMSIFYVIFFGMMLSDAGYGILMSVATAVILKKKPRLGDGLKKMLKLFFWCGLSTAFWGFMYGGFFGDAIDVVATTFFGYTGATPILKPLWFAPLEDPMRLLIYCLLFGLIHLYAGLGMKGYEYLKDGDVVGFLSDVVAWYLFLTGLVLMLIPSDIFASLSGSVITFPAWLNTLAKVITLVGVAVILLMSGRTNKNWGVRIALGAYDLYGVTSWLSDILSYSRLLALGLATGVIASVINMMAAIGGGGIVGVLVFIPIFIGGHILNIAINALGAYVHTNRLQYVEFFGKFYDAGGRAFKPFKNANRNVEIKEENSL